MSPEIKTFMHHRPGGSILHIAEWTIDITLTGNGGTWITRRISALHVPGSDFEVERRALLDEANAQLLAEVLVGPER